MRRHLPPVAAFAAFATLAAPALAQGVTAFTHVTLIDGRGGAALPDVTVIVRGTTIASVGPGASATIPPGAVVVAGRGKTLLPGLADMHVHLTGGWDGERADLLGFPRYLNALLYAGVTTVHDMGNVLLYVQQLKQEIAAGRLIGPRLYMVGALVDGADPVWPDISFALVSTAQARGIVQKLQQSGADAIKAYVGLSERQLTALVRAAAVDSLPVIADLGANNGSDWGVRAGIAAFAHAGRQPMSDATVAEMKARGMMNISTLAVMESFSERRLAQLAFLDDSLLTQSMPKEFSDELRAYVARPRTGADSAAIRRSTVGFEVARANVRKLHLAGVPIVAGTDSPYPGVFFGEGLHRELELLVEAGLTPIEAISAATRNAARLARDTTWGTVEAGKRADLILVDGRPHERIADTRRIVSVMQGGRLLAREQLVLRAQRDGRYRTTGTPPSTK